MSSEYAQATRRAVEIVKNTDHDSIYLCTTNMENGGTNLELVSGVDSDSIGKRTKGVVRLEQAALHIQHLAELSGRPPGEIALGIANAIESGSVSIDLNEM